MGTTLAFTAAGTTLAIHATAPATLDAAGYGTLYSSMTDVGEIVDFGEIGRTYNEITHNPVGTRETFKFKGSYDDGGLTLSMAKAPTDAGQVILIAALASDDDYYFAIELNDNPGGSNTFLFFAGKVMSAPDQIGSVDTIVGKSMSIRVNGSIIEVAATS